MHGAAGRTGPSYAALQLQRALHSETADGSPGPRCARPWDDGYWTLGGLPERFRDCSVRCMLRRVPFRAVSATRAALIVLGCVSAASPQAAPLVPFPLKPVSGPAFVEAVNAADIYEVSSGGYALKRSSSSAVKEFAQVMVDEHRNATRRLKWVLMKPDSYVVLPTHISTEYMFVMDRLVAASAADFDRVYVAQQMAAHRDALMLAEEYARAGDDLVLRRFAKASVPEIRMHLEMITQIAQQELAVR
jgi:putative membrane protein